MFVHIQYLHIWGLGLPVVIRHIYDRDQQLSPGALTMLKVWDRTHSTWPHDPLTKRVDHDIGCNGLEFCARSGLRLVRVAKVPPLRVFAA